MNHQVAISLFAARSCMSESRHRAFSRTADSDPSITFREIDGGCLLRSKFQNGKLLVELAKMSSLAWFIKTSWLFCWIVCLPKFGPFLKKTRKQTENPSQQLDP